MSLKYIKGFDALRAVSVILVILTHMGIFNYLPDNSFVRERLWYLFSGSTGVNIFFALSGFLITRILLSEKKQQGTISFKNFYARRFLRLTPPLLIFLIIISWLMSEELIRSNMKGFMMSFLYLYNFVPLQYHVTELGHTWSLAMEEQFYLLWPAVILFFPRSRALAISIFMICLCIFSLYIYPHISFGYNGTNINMQDMFMTSRWFFPGVGPIIIGAFAGYVSFENNGLGLNKFNGSFIQLFTGMVLFATPLFFSRELMDLVFLFQAAGISMFLIWILHHQDNQFISFLEWPPLLYIGRISYGLYVYQGIFLRTGPGGELTIQQFPLNIVITILLAILSYEIIEKKALKLKSRFT